VKAYRRRAREGTLAPVLLWFVTPLDGWLILDGHDRAPPRRRRARTPSAWCSIEPSTTMSGAWPKASAPFVLADLPCEAARTVAWPLPGGPAAWDDLAARAMFECPRD
jgi:hypothetical protein